MPPTTAPWEGRRGPAEPFVGSTRGALECLPMTSEASSPPAPQPPAASPPGAPRRRARISRDDPPERRFPVIYRRLDREYPGAKTALNFSNPYEMLFATILSAQTTDATVNKVTAELFRKYPTLEDYANADREA